MTLSDPLLKELKGHIAKLVLSSSPPFGDDNEKVFLLCHCLESIFRRGLIRQGDGFTPWRADTFSWFYQLVRKYHRVIPLSFKMAFEEVLNDPKTRTQIGKTRLLIRNCLKRRCLHFPVQFHVENQDYNDDTLRVTYNPDASILGHEILSQIFLSLLMQLSHYDFNFDLSNASFLDDSWQIPHLLKCEFVPCDSLGITLGFPMGFAVIVNIIDNSLAAEIGDKIAVGDIMDEFNGVCVRNFYGSKIENLFRKNRSKPFKITFIKATDTSNKLFFPAIKLYRILGLDPEKLTYSKANATENQDAFDLQLNEQDDNIQEEEDFEGNLGGDKCKEPLKTTLLIQGLLPEDFDEEEISNKDSSSIMKPQTTTLIQTEQSTIQNILDELTISPLLHIDLLQDNDNGSGKSVNPVLESTSGSPPLLNLDLNPALVADMTSLSKSDKSDELLSTAEMTSEIPSSNRNDKEQEQSQRQEQNNSSVFQKQYYDDTNPCMV